MKLAFFGFTWNINHKLDAYTAEIVSSFSKLGFDVDIYNGSKFTSQHGIYGFKDTLSLNKLADVIAENNYDVAVSFNNCLLLPEIIKSVNGNLVSVIVDQVEHLFNHRSRDLYEPFKYDVDYVAMSSTIQRDIRERVPGIQDRIHLIPPATNLDRAIVDSTNSARPHAISWIASLLGDLTIEQYMNIITELPEGYAVTNQLLQEIERSGSLKIFREDPQQVIPNFARDAFGWSMDYYEMQLQNIITNRQRVEVVERLEPLGLALFGNPAWRRLLSSNGKIFSALQPGPPIFDHEQLKKIYNNSRLSINLPQNHTTPDAIQYRVVDIMSSRSLLLTKANKASDLYRFFGADCPVPTYNTLDEMEALCRHYLSHEAERRSLVEACNALITEDYSFRQQCLTLLSICGVKPPTAETASGPVPGRVQYVDTDQFLHEKPGSNSMNSGPISIR